MNRSKILLSAASLIALTTPAQAADYLFGGSGAVPQGQEITSTGTTQFKLDDGSTVSLVGNARFRLDNGQLTVLSGGVTVASPRGRTVQVRTPGGTRVRLSGSGSLNVTPQGVTGNVMRGQMMVGAGGGTRRYQPGDNWAVTGNSAPRQVLANAAQQSPQQQAGAPQLKGNGVSGAAQNGLPVTLGEALAAIGASGDIVSSANNLQQTAQNPALGTVPAADVDNLLEFAASLSGALGGGQAFDGAAPGVVDAYLRFLADGGQIAEFQTAFAALVGQYLDILANGGVPTDFDGVDLTGLNAYLAFLQSTNALDLIGAQQGLLAAYLDFLADGGIPTDFAAPGAFLDDAVVAEYVAAIQDYIAFLTGGGNPADFATAPDLIEAYLDALNASGLLATLFAGQADALTAYLDFINGGGDPANFDGFGLSDQLAAEYAQALTAFFDFVNAGGVPSEFQGLPAEVFLAYLQALQNADLFGELFAENADFFSDYLDFLLAGGAIDDFDGLPDPISDEQRLLALNNFLAFIANDGNVPSEFDGETLATLSQYFDDLEFSNLETLDAEDRALLDDFFFYTQVEGLGADTYPVLAANGGFVDTVQTAYSFTKDGETAQTFGAFARPVLFQSDGRPFRGVPTNGSSIAIRDNDVTTVQSGDADISVARIFGDGFTEGGQTFTLTANQGVHAAFVPGIETLPTDTIIYYDLAFATAPTFADGAVAPGTFDADVALKFGSGVSLATEGTVSFEGDATYAFTTPGGIAGIEDLDASTFPGATSGALIQQSDIALTGEGKACATGADCTLFMAALPGGASAEYLGVSYESRNGGGGSTPFFGAAAFTQGEAPDNGGGNNGGDGGNNGGGEIPTPTYTLNGLEGQVDIASGLFFSAFTGTRLEGFGGTNPVEVPFTQTGFRQTNSLAYDAEGKLVQYFKPAVVEKIGTMTAVEVFGTENSQIGRWTDGTIDSQGPDLVASANQGLTYLVVDPAPGFFELPTDLRVDYVLGGATSPIVYSETDAIAPGVFDGQMSVLYGATPKVALEAGIWFDTPDGGYNINYATTGGLANAEQSTTDFNTFAANFQTGGGKAFSFGVEGDDPDCAFCFLNVQGGFAGDDVSELPFFYTASVFGGNAVAHGAGIFLSDQEGLPKAVPDLPDFADLVGNVRADQIIAYTGQMSGIDQRQPASVVYDDTTGAPIGYRWELNDFTRENEVPTIGNASQNESGSVGDIIGWTRWAGGIQGGNYYGNNTELAANGGEHLVSGTPATNLPQSGTVNYALVGATAPTIRDGRAEPGTFDGNLAVAFGAETRVGFDFDVEVGTATYGFGTDGGAANAAVGGALVNTSGDETLNMTFSANALAVETVGNATAVCGFGSCQAGVRGFLAGDGASHVGVAYTIGANGGSSPNFISGAAAFGTPAP